MVRTGAKRADGVVYAETRWAPHQHTEAGLSLDDAGFAPEPQGRALREEVAPPAFAPTREE